MLAWLWYQLQSAYCYRSLNHFVNSACGFHKSKSLDYIKENGGYSKVALVRTDWCWSAVPQTSILPGRQRSPNTSRLRAFTPLWLSILSCNRNRDAINVGFQSNSFILHITATSKRFPVLKGIVLHFRKPPYWLSCHELDEKVDTTQLSVH